MACRAFAAVVFPVLALAACDGSRSTPVIGVSYRARDSAFVAFLQSELDRVRPAGGVAIRVREIGLDPVPADSARSPR